MTSNDAGGKSLQTHNTPLYVTYLYTAVFSTIIMLLHFFCHGWPYIPSLPLIVRNLDKKSIMIFIFTPVRYAMMACAPICKSSMFTFWLWFYDAKAICKTSSLQQHEHNAHMQAAFKNISTSLYFLQILSFLFFLHERAFPAAVPLIICIKIVLSSSFCILGNPVRKKWCDARWTELDEKEIFPLS